MTTTISSAKTLNSSASVTDRPLQDAGTIDEEEVRRFRMPGGDLIAPPTTSDQPWFKYALPKLFSFLDYPHNWDTYGAQPIHPKAIENALSLLGRIMRNDTPIPYCIPTCRGHVQLEWSTRGVDLEIEVFRDGTMEVLFEDLTHQHPLWEETLSEDNIERIQDAINVITGRRH